MDIIEKFRPIFGKEAEKAIKLVNLKEIHLTKLSSNLNRSELEHILSELCVWLQTTQFYQSKFIFFFLG